MAETEAPRRALWKRVFNAVSNALTVKEIWALLGLGGGSAGVATANPSGHYVPGSLEWWSVVVAAFCFGAVGTIGVAYGARSVAPSVARWWRRTFSEPPYLKVTPCGGTEAVLEIENSGGRCSLTAWGRIVAVSQGWDVKKRDSYPMLWRMDWERAYMQAPQGAVARRNGHPLKLLIAAHEIITVGALDVPQTIVAIFGGPGKVDAIHIDPKHGSPVVTIEVRINSDPPLRAPFVRRYDAEIKSGYQRTVELTDVTP